MFRRGSGSTPYPPIRTNRPSELDGFGHWRNWSRHWYVIRPAICELNNGVQLALSAFLLGPSTFSTRPSYRCMISAVPLPEPLVHVEGARPSPHAECHPQHEQPPFPDVRNMRKKIVRIYFPQQIQGFLQLSFRLTWETDNDVRGEKCPDRLPSVGAFSL